MGPVPLKSGGAWVTHEFSFGHELASAGPFAKVPLLAAIPRLWPHDGTNLSTLVSDCVICESHMLSWFRLFQKTGSKPFLKLPTDAACCPDINIEDVVLSKMIEEIKKTLRIRNVFWCLGLKWLSFGSSLRVLIWGSGMRSWWVDIALLLVAKQNPAAAVTIMSNLTCLCFIATLACIWYIDFLPPHCFGVSCRCNFSNKFFDQSMKRRHDLIFECLFFLCWKQNRWQHWLVFGCFLGEATTGPYVAKGAADGVLDWTR